MNILWDINPATAQTVRQRLRRELGYYRPAVKRDQVAGSAVKDLIDRLFGGSAENLVMNLVESRQLTPEKLARLQRMLKAKEARDE